MISDWLANDPASHTSASFDARVSKAETRSGDFRLQDGIEQRSTISPEGAYLL